MSFAEFVFPHDKCLERDPVSSLFSGLQAEIAKNTGVLIANITIHEPAFSAAPPETADEVIPRPTSFPRGDYTENKYQAGNKSASRLNPLFSSWKSAWDYSEVD
jgi:hypothetical protein